jgi:hypothetical protein
MTSRLQSFETELLTEEENLAGLALPFAPCTRRQDAVRECLDVPRSFNPKVTDRPPQAGAGNPRVDAAALHDNQRGAVDFISNTLSEGHHFRS